MKSGWRRTQVIIVNHGWGCDVFIAATIHKNLFKSPRLSAVDRSVMLYGPCRCDNRRLSAVGEDACVSACWLFHCTRRCGNLLNVACKSYIHITFYRGHSYEMTIWLFIYPASQPARDKRQMSSNLREKNSARIFNNIMGFEVIMLNAFQ